MNLSSFFKIFITILFIGDVFSTERKKELPFTHICDVIEKQKSIFISRDGTTKEEITIGKCVGGGGSKNAYFINEKEVIMLPSKFISQKSLIWNRIVEEEVKASSIYRAKGLLAVESEKVDVYLSSDAKECFPAYVSKSFSFLSKEKDMYVIDVKNKESSQWKGVETCYNINSCTKRKKNSFFPEDTKKRVFSNWYPIIAPLLKDLKTLLEKDLYQYVASLDCRNFVVIKEFGSDNKPIYTIRLFLFDFSSERIKKSFDKFRPRKIDEPDISETLAFLIDKLLPQIFFEQIYYDNFDKKINGLPEEYKKIITIIKNNFEKIVNKDLNIFKLIQDKYYEKKFSEYDLEKAQKVAKKGLFTQEQLDNAKKDLFTQEQLDNAKKDLFTQEQLQEQLDNAKKSLFTQEDLENARAFHYINIFYWMIFIALGFTGERLFVLTEMIFPIETKQDSWDYEEEYEYEQDF